MCIAPNNIASVSNSIKSVTNNINTINSRLSLTAASLATLASAGGAAQAATIIQNSTGCKGWTPPC